jgi:GNAT superfamily N-acetyltransferase
MAEAWSRGEFVISTDRERLDYDAIHSFLNLSYWATGISLDVVQRSIEHSLPFGVYHGNQLVGFGRVITDYTTFAYLADIFVVPAQRGHGLGKWLIETILQHPRLQGLRSWVLITRDAQEFYRAFGFDVVTPPRTYMRRPGTV